MHRLSPAPNEMADLPVHQLRFVQSNPHVHSPEQLQAAEQALAVKLAAWRAHNAADVATVDALIRQYTWLDMCVLRYDGHRLTVAGTMDPSYYHQLEITFVDVYYYSGPVRGDWHSDTTQAVLSLPMNDAELHTKLEIEQDYQLFVLQDEDRKAPIHVAAHHRHGVLLPTRTLAARRALGRLGQPRRGTRR